jgi:hypothetical protein
MAAGVEPTVSPSLVRDWRLWGPFDPIDCHSLEVINAHSGEMGRNSVSWPPNTWPENGMMFEARFSRKDCAPRRRRPPSAPCTCNASSITGAWAGRKRLGTPTCLCREGDPYTQLCVAYRPFDRRLKTKFDPDVGKFLRVHVAPVQGEKAESREASFAEVDLWHTGADPDLD